ncbi:hypothetical protein QAD02_018600 [Eretmocerus hayati]|uniref:Uncharacterized protein n=1 Tax=Eretmocerus hayati TaxID=131215 RepID=A0ACC2PH57_9HYME|nr:hypothetical protein QAD02_018600 [Eretmocerus hayati]
MNEPGDSVTDETFWSSGLRRCYSEYADIVLKQSPRHRRRLSPESTLPRHSRSGPTFRLLPEGEDNNTDTNHAREEQISSGRQHHVQQQNRRKITKCGCGDTNEITGNLSDMSLERDSRDYESNTILEPKFSSTTSHDTRGTVSSSDLHYDNEFENDFGEFEHAFDMDDPGLYRRLIDHKLSHADRGDHAELSDMNAFIGAHTYSTSSICSEISENETGTERRVKHHHNGLIRQISYENWAQEKRRELQRRRDEAKLAESKKREIEEQEKREREEREKKDYENFVQWVEHKKRQKILENKLRQKEIELQKKIEETESKLKDVKDINLMQWHRRKEIEKKETAKEKLMKRKEAEEEKKKRLEKSFQAYQKWREKAKSTPRPATQGLLPHQKAKPAFTNPQPWQPLIDNISDGSDDGLDTKPSNVTLKSQQRRKNSVKR